MKPKPVGIPRCKDCVFCVLRSGKEKQYKCTHWNNTTALDAFCSYGVKKSG